ncbi:hypothetical protein CDN99_20270 [Roseateles aquatilis]|uniref:Iron uptake protein n=1 Tax=Roseateles aquatilis TaxID=431061 RepID=A0A246J0Q1_9BURK|nr:DUF3649 domain-containing protein [Roseateles aquatilis]OWQ86177.1 hypothetical protein CDN99_20270 [Roseateles aquatilis]
MAATGASKTAAALPWRYRAAVASRVIAALGGGYALASAVAAAIAVHGQPLLSGSRSEGAIAGAMLGFVAYAVAFMTAFAARSAWRAWAWVLGPALLLGASVMKGGWT